MKQRGSLVTFGSLALLALVTCFVACGGGAGSPDGGDASVDRKPGSSGTAGTTGAAGKPGTAGTTGAGGKYGFAGTTGAAGKPGTAGTTGAAGKPGTAGTTGAAGTTAGGAGTTGTAGTGGPLKECLDMVCDGTCKGESCTGAWECDMTAAICTLDVAEYCGCDDVTFLASSSCPNRAFAHRGACATVSCDLRKVTCKIAVPNCPSDQVPSVNAAGTCYGPCVDIDACACTAAAQCPNADKYTCHVGAKHCGPYVL